MSQRIWSESSFLFKIDVNYGKNIHKNWHLYKLRCGRIDLARFGAVIDNFYEMGRRKCKKYIEKIWNFRIFFWLFKYHFLYFTCKNTVKKISTIVADINMLLAGISLGNEITSPYEIAPRIPPNMMMKVSTLVNCLSWNLLNRITKTTVAKTEKNHKVLENCLHRAL